MRKFLAIRPRQSVQCFSTSRARLDDTTTENDGIAKLSVRLDNPIAAQDGANPPVRIVRIEKPTVYKSLQDKLGFAGNIHSGIDPFEIFDEPAPAHPLINRHKKDGRKPGSTESRAAPIGTKETYVKPPRERVYRHLTLEDKKAVEQRIEIIKRWKADKANKAQKHPAKGEVVRFVAAEGAKISATKSTKSTSTRPPPPPQKQPPPSTPSPEAELATHYHSPTGLTTRQLATLPQSPLMSPPSNFWTEKAYKMKRRPAEDEELTPLQRKLSRNPYAQALASPTRRCPITRMMLPRHFLLGLEVLENPKTGTHWYLPADLSTPVKSENAMVRRSRQSEEGDEDGEPSYVDIPITGSNHRPRIGQRKWVLLSHSLLSGLSNPLSGWFGKSGILQSIAPQGTYKGGVQWRKDMDSFVLNLLRKRAVHDISNSFWKHRSFVAYEPNWEKLVGKRRGQAQLGAVLWLGREYSERSERTANESGKKVVTGPGPFATLSLPKWGGKLAIHNLRTLLGEEQLEVLKKKAPPLKTANGEAWLIAVKDKFDTVRLRELLWRLEIYLASAAGSEGEAEGSMWSPKDDEVKQ